MFRGFYNGCGKKKLLSRGKFIFLCVSCVCLASAVVGRHVLWGPVLVTLRAHPRSLELCGLFVLFVPLNFSPSSSSSCCCWMDSKIDDAKNIIIAGGVERGWVGEERVRAGINTRLDPSPLFFLSFLNLNLWMKATDTKGHGTICPQGLLLLLLLCKKKEEEN